MAFKNVTSILVLGVLCASVCSANNANQTIAFESTTDESSLFRKLDDSQEMNQTEIMLACNETFHTPMEFLIELNSTGSFPDETDKTPMCYIRCYLEKVGIINQDAILNRERAIEMEWATSEDTLDDCEKESRGQTNTCERAYYLTRCVMLRNLIDNRKYED